MQCCAELQSALPRLWSTDSGLTLSQVSLKITLGPFYGSLVNSLTPVLQLYEAMKGLPEYWWWSPHDNNAEQSKFSKIEPKQKMKVGCSYSQQGMSVCS